MRKGTQLFIGSDQRPAAVEQSDLDSVGEPALWVWAVYDVVEVDLEAARQAESLIRKSIADAGNDRWVFVRFLTREEFEEDNDTEDNQEAL